MRFVLLLVPFLLLAACDRGAVPEPAAQAEPPAAGDTAPLQQVMLSVPGMTCAACPITVRKALESVDGVHRATVDFDSKSAVVLFDSARTDVAALLAATAEAGYPATVAGDAAGGGTAAP